MLDGFENVLSEIIISFQPLIPFFATTAAVGIIISGTYHWIRTFHLKKTQIYLDLTKKKFEKINDLSKYYLQMSALSTSISQCILNDEDATVIFKDVCSFFYKYGVIYDKFGGIIVDNRIAETILAVIIQDIYDNLEKKLDYSSLAKMYYFGENSPSYDTFQNDIIPNNKHIFRAFEEISDEEVIRKDLNNLFLWFSELIKFELLHADKLWYNKEPKFAIQSSELEEYLINIKNNPFVINQFTNIAILEASLKSYLLRLRTSGKNKIHKLVYRTWWWFYKRRHISNN